MGLVKYWLQAAQSFFMFGFIAAFAQEQPEIHLNQVGFYPKEQKKAVIVNAKADSFYLVSPKNNNRLWSGVLGKEKYWPHSDEKVKIADFSAFSQVGTYRLDIPGKGTSNPFKISNHRYHSVAHTSLKSFYFLRASTTLTKRYAGLWTRKAGHPDTAVRIHITAASDKHPEGSIISAPGGWYDAGDYGKYVVNSCYATWHLLTLFQNYPLYSRKLKANIPGSKGIPDVLNEALYNIRWLITMQDPEDGGVYHKLTTAQHAPMVMPAEDTAARYVIYKSTAATLDLCAVMAKASTIYRAFERQLPHFADSCLVAAKRAWAWAKEHPNRAYNQQQVNQKFDPDIRTGEYGDKNFEDEMLWAAAELFVCTGESQYLEICTEKIKEKSLKLQSWQFVYPLGLISILEAAHKESVLSWSNMKQQLLAFADSLVAYADSSAYATPMGIDVSNFSWGSNGVAASQGVLLVEAFRLSENNKYLTAALQNIDYILGRNPTGFCFVTGAGQRSPKNPHYRPSIADKISKVVPGFLVGGPFPGQADSAYCGPLRYPSAFPAKSYLDDACSFASNEIAINWNGPLVLLINSLEAIMQIRRGAITNSSRVQKQR